MTNMDFEEKNVEESYTSPQANTLTSNPEKLDNYPPASCNMNAAQQVHNEPMVCAGCLKPIYDQYYMWVDKRAFHEACVQCDVCRTPLSESCYAKNHKLYCPQDYKQLQKCHRCSNLIPLSEFVLNVSGHPYHVTCFACDVCHQPLQSGDQYHMTESTNRIYCKSCHDQSNHVIDSSVDPEVDSASDSESDDDLFSHQSMSMSDISYLSGYGGANDLHPNQMMLQRKNGGKIRLSPMTSCSSDGKRIKRPRTILTTAQRRKFKASFEVSQKPCRKVRETLAAETGLSPRVVQVWFQNQRAKVKKLARRQQSDGHNSQSGQRSRRKKTLDSDSDNELSSPSSYVSMSTALQTSFYHETFRSPGSMQTSPTASITDINSFHQITPNTHDPTPEFLYDDFDSSLFSGETFATSSTPSRTHLASLKMETSLQGDHMATLSRPSSDFNINAASSYHNPGQEADLQPESSPQDVFPQFGSLQTLNSFPSHATNEGNPIDRLMCMQSTFFRT